MTWYRLPLFLWLVLCLPGCPTANRTAGPPPRPELKQVVESGQASWVVANPPRLEGDTLPRYYLIQSATPIPGSAIYRLVGVAQDAGRASGARAVQIVYLQPGVQLSTNGLNAVVPAAEDADVRVGGDFGRIIGQVDPSTMVLNVGALDGVFEGSRYAILGEPTPTGSTSPLSFPELGTCVVKAGGIFDLYAHCTLADGVSTPEVAFVRRVTDGSSRGGDAAWASQDPEAGCQVSVPPGGALEALGAPSVCRLLRKARGEFAQRFGTYGEGGELGLYLDQSYLDPRSTEKATIAGWGGAPQRARLDDRARQWLAKPDQRVLVIFGPQGSGKTTFGMKFAHDQARQTLELGQGRVPVFVSLARTLEPGESLTDVDGKMLIARTLKATTGATVEVAQVGVDLAAGVLVPIFDGLDEVTQGVPLPVATRSYSNLIRSTTTGSAKVMILCRSSSAGADPLAELNKVLYQAIDASPAQTRVTLVPFDQDLLETYLTRLMPDPEKRDLARAQLQATYDLDTLARTPLLLFLVARYLAREDAPALPESPWELYHTYSEGWSSEVLGGRGVSEADQAAFLQRSEALGVALAQQGATELDEPSLQRFIAQSPWLSIPTEPGPGWAVALSEARGGSFLVKGAAGTVRFVDPSFGAYFAAQGLARVLRPALLAPPAVNKELEEALSALPLRDDVLRFLGQALGSDPGIDVSLSRLLRQGTDARTLGALYRLRLLRQDLTDPQKPARPGGMAEAARAAYAAAYQAENEQLKAQAAAGVASLLRSPAGSRYQGVEGKPWLVKDRQEGTLWAWIPAIPHLQGTVGSDGGSLTRRTPSRPFLAGVYPVTHQDFTAFVGARSYSAHPPPAAAPGSIFLATWGRSFEPPSGKLDRPLTWISWADALAYARWRTNQVGVTERPFTEGEWELTSRGAAGRQYPWGDAFEKARALSRLGEATEPIAVGEMPGGESPFGVMGMSGNVWQWTYRGEVTGEAAQPVLRGGSWQSSPLQLTTTTRRADLPTPQLRAEDVGLRLRRDIPESALRAP